MPRPAASWPSPSPTRRPKRCKRACPPCCPSACAACGWAPSTACAIACCGRTTRRRGCPPRFRFWICKTSSRPSSGCARPSTWIPSATRPSSWAGFLPVAKKTACAPKMCPRTTRIRAKRSSCTNFTKTSASARAWLILPSCCCALTSCCATTRPCASTTNSAFATCWSMSFRTPTSCNTSGSNCWPGKWKAGASSAPAACWPWAMMTKASTPFAAHAWAICKTFCANLPCRTRSS